MIAVYFDGFSTGGKGMGAAEGGIRVPGIYRWPGHIPAGVTSDAPISMLDTLPTILELAGLPSLHDLMPHLPYRVCNVNTNFQHYFTGLHEYKELKCILYCTTGLPRKFGGI